MAATIFPLLGRDPGTPLTISAAQILQALSSIIPPQVVEISRTIKERGHQSWLVGGSVRDLLLHLETGQNQRKGADWDLATSARPEEIQKMFRRVIPTGIEHGTVTVVLSKSHFEVTTLRGEKGHSDGRRPDEVFYVKDLNEDLARRDFTINAMAINLEDKTFHDPFGGRDDLGLRVLRAVGEPLTRFSEDGLRVLRCARFCATLDFEVEEATRKAILPSIPTFQKVAGERVRDEWFKALRSASPSRFFQVIHSEGLLNVTAPELASLVSQDQRFLDILRRVDAAPANEVLRLALLLSLTAGPRENHQETSSTLIAQSLSRALKLSKKERSQLLLFVQHAELPQELQTRPTGLEARKWLSQVGREAAAELIAFQKLAAAESDVKLHEAHTVIEEQLAADCALSLSELAIGGADLISEGAVTRGPAVGEALKRLLAAVIEEPACNQRDQLLKLARDDSNPT
jgi:tRNA nucleotidyltransferase (CCA-adding enzyme)